MQENPINNENTLAANITPQELQEKCLSFLESLSEEEKKELDYAVNMAGYNLDTLRVSLEIEAEDDNLKTFFRLIARYKLCKKLEGEEAKADAKAALKEIAELFR